MQTGCFCAKNRKNSNTSAVCSDGAKMPGCKKIFFGKTDIPSMYRITAHKKKGDDHLENTCETGICRVLPDPRPVSYFRYCNGRDKDRDVR